MNSTYCVLGENTIRKGYLSGERRRANAGKHIPKKYRLLIEIKNETLNLLLAPPSQ